MSTDKGYFCYAANEDQLNLAYGLALTIKLTQPRVNSITVAVPPGTEVTGKDEVIFDHIIEVQHNFDVLSVTPYQKTIFVSPDMLLVNNIENWWDVLASRPFTICSKALTYRNHPVDDSFYRKCFSDNGLLNVYSSFVFFDKASPLTQEIFACIDLIRINWPIVSEHYLISTSRPDSYSPSLLFALAFKLLGHSDKVISHLDVPTFVNMRSNSQKWTVSGMAPLEEDWTKQISHWYNPPDIKIGNYHIQAPIRYHRVPLLSIQHIIQLERTVGL